MSVDIVLSSLVEMSSCSAIIGSVKISTFSGKPLRHPITSWELAVVALASAYDRGVVQIGYV